MTLEYNGVKPSLEELAHYGVKGMRWGKRKNQTNEPLKLENQRLNRKPTREEILNARKIQKDLHQQINALDKKHGKDPESPKHFKFTKEHEDAYEKLLEGDARVISKYKTRGEQAVATMLLGPVGLVVASNTQFRIRSRIVNQRA